MKSNISPSEVKSDNELIAEFMGIEIRNRRVYITGRGGYIQKNYPHQLKYHNNWSWLMPVCIKLELKTVSTDIKTTYNDVINRILGADKRL